MSAWSWARGVEGREALGPGPEPGAGCGLWGAEQGLGAPARAWGCAPCPRLGAACSATVAAGPPVSHGASPEQMPGRQEAPGLPLTHQKALLRGPGGGVGGGERPGRVATEVV